MSTLIRPTAGAVVGALLAGDVTADQSLDKVVLASVGGVTALLSHLVKGGVRLAVNSSPEPVTNIGISILEDVVVFGVVAVAIAHPWLAATVAGRCWSSGWCCCTSSPGWSGAAGGAGSGGARLPPEPLRDEPPRPGGPRPT